MIFLRHKYMRRSKILRVWIISMKFSKRLMASLFLEETWELTFHQKMYVLIVCGIIVYAICCMLSDISILLPINYSLQW